MHLFIPNIYTIIWLEANRHFNLPFSTWSIISFIIKCRPVAAHRLQSCLGGGGGWHCSHHTPGGRKGGSSSLLNLTPFQFVSFASKCTCTQCREKKQQKNPQKLRMYKNSFKANGKGKDSEFKLQIPQRLNSFITKMQLSEPPWLFASSQNLAGFTWLP